LAQAPFLLFIVWPLCLLAMARRLLTSVLWCAGPASVSALAAAILGVEPGQEASYTGSTFRCLDGNSAPLPVAVVNDEACDCADGSDEPGTGACAGQDQTLFFCANKGSIPQKLYASRVGDGVCDCCDGSDEASLAQRQPSRACADRCVEEGAQVAVDREAKVAMLRRALARQEEIRKTGLGTRDKLLAEMEVLDADLPALESALEGHKQAADLEREAEAAETAKKEAEEAAKKAAEGPACMWRQTTGCAPDGEREAEHDHPCSEGTPKGNSGFCDCDGDGAKSEAEPGFTCEVGESDTEERLCFELCAPVETPKTETPPADDAAAEVAAEEEKPQTSEYAKWMDDSEKVQTDAEKPKKEVSEYAKWMDDSEKVQTEGEATPATEEAAPEEPKEEEAVEAAKEDTAVEKETAAQTKVTEHKDKVKELQDSLDSLEADHLGFATLHDNKLSKQVGEFSYDIEFGKSASQDSTSLGNWAKWTGPRSATFEGGTMCWGGPERKLNVNFICGEKEEILDVFEPSRCVYEATIEHPGACENAELEMLAQGKQIRHPKDEL